MSDFSSEDFWRAIILYGLNQATYKIALGKTLISLANNNSTNITWDKLSFEFFNQYKERLSAADPMPQQSNPMRRTFMERAVMKLESGASDLDETIDSVGANAFDDVIRRFHNLGGIVESQNKFYEYNFGKSLILTDEFHKVVENEKQSLIDELDARWALLEGAFAIKSENYELGNEILKTYISKGHERKNLTDNVPFLQGYQGNSCFYCGEIIPPDAKVHVDHVLPRQVINHDEIWNLVNAHEHCNLMKEDYLVGMHFIEKLMKRNENIIGSNHPWKNNIRKQLGANKKDRRSSILFHYENVKQVLGNNYWNGSSSYNPESDPFYKKFITLLNNK